MAKAGRGSEQVMIRLPDGMRDRLKDAAERNARSMNAEIVARLEESFEGFGPRDNEELATARSIIENLLLTLETSPNDILRIGRDIDPKLFLSGLSPRELRLLTMKAYDKALGAVVEGLEGDERDEFLKSMDKLKNDALGRVAKVMAGDGWKVEPPDASLRNARTELERIDSLIAKADDLQKPEEDDR
jgi:plasmid stability protein